MTERAGEGARCGDALQPPQATALAVVALALVSALPILGVAAETPDAESSTPTDRRAVGLDTIVVTAQKHLENVQDVAMAVAAFSDDELLEAGVTDAMQLQTIVPSLTYVATGYLTQPYLRGIGTRLSTVGLEPSIVTYIDDRYVARPFGAMFDMLDVERVEILKGPQGVLYGRNAAGGAIRAITRDPQDRSVEIAGRVGNYAGRRLQVAAGGPLSDKLRGQITAAAERRAGFATNVVPSGRAMADDVDRQIYRGKLLWDVTDGIDAKLTISGWHYADWGGRDLVAAGVPEANRGVALYGGVTSREQDEFATTITGDDDLNETAADLRFDVSLGDLSFVSVTTYTETDFDYTFDVDASSITLVDLNAIELSETWSQEFQLLSREGASLEWVGGGYFYSQKASNLFVFEDPVSAQPAFALGTDVSNGLQGVVTDSSAVFAQGSYAFRERWTATLGGRWTRESKQATVDAVPGVVTTPSTPYADARNWEDFTPHVALEHRRNFGLVYLSYSRGFKGGGYSYPAPLNPVLRPETLDSYEVGIKSDLADDRLRLSSAFFFYDLKDLQVSRNFGGESNTTENAAGARVRGLEVDVEMLITDNLSLRSGIALVDSEYLDYTAAVLMPLMVPPYGSEPLSDGLDVSGHSLLRSPDEAAYVGLDYGRGLANGAGVRVSIDYSYKGDYYFDFSAVPTTEWLEQDAYGLLNARVAYSSPGNAWEIGLWGGNLTDASYYEDAVVTSVSSRASYADPRTYGIDFKLRL